MELVRFFRGGDIIEDRCTLWGSPGGVQRWGVCQKAAGSSERCAPVGYLCLCD